MTDTISGSLAAALPPQSAPIGLEAQANTNFDQILQSPDPDGLRTGNTLAGTESEINPQERIAQVEEFESRVMTLDRAGRVDYFAERIEGTNAQLLKLRRDIARQPNRFERSAVQAFDSCSSNYRELSGFLEEFASGRNFDQHELLAMQIRSHQIMQSVEILSKTVEQTVSGMKTIFQTNV